MLVIYLLAKDDSEVSKELKDRHPNSPLTFLGHLAKRGEELWCTKEVSPNDLGDIHQSEDHIVFHL